MHIKTPFFQQRLSFVRVAGCVGLLMLMAGCHSTNGWVMNNSGMGYYQKGNYAMARGDFERAVLDSPRNPDFRHNLAMAMQKQGDPVTAEQVLRHNLSVDPMHHPTYHALTVLLMSQQRLDEADQLLAGWRESQPYVPEAYVEQAWFQHETGNTAAAEQTLRQALQVKPNHPVALAHLGQLHHESGQTDQAAAYYQRSLMSRWNQPEVKSRLATLDGSAATGRRMRRSAMVHNQADMQMASMNPIPISATPPMMVSSDQSMLLTGGQPMGAPVDQSMMVSADPSMLVTGNQPMMAPGSPPIVAAPGQPMVMANDQPMVLVGGMPVDGQPWDEHSRRPRRQRRGRELKAYPLPDFSQVGMEWQQGLAAADPASVSPGIAAPPAIVPEFATAPGQPMIAPPDVAAGPTPIPQADPAHATETTAGLPVVDPY